MVAYFTGGQGDDVRNIAAALATGRLVLPPVVVTELLSDPNAGDDIQADLSELASLSILEGYWERAGQIRRVLHKHRLKAKIADALIAQFCLDHGLSLITRDRDFRHFARHCGLGLA